VVAVQFDDSTVDEKTGLIDYYREMQGEQAAKDKFALSFVRIFQPFTSLDEFALTTSIILLQHFEMADCFIFYHNQI
jgi:hypothetical protein